MKYLSVLVSFFIYSFASAQDDCKCSKNFDEINQKVRDNYSGFSMKVTPLTKLKFEELTKQVKQNVKGIKDPKACLEAIKPWMSFFQDGHLFINTQLSIKETEDPALVIERANKVSSQKFTSEQNFQNYLSDNLSKLSEIEGIWESDDKAYRIGIVKDAINSKKLAAFIFDKRDDLWVAGKNKFELETIGSNKFSAKYFYADFTSEISFARQIKNILVIENIYKFQKISPTPQEFASQNELIHKIPDYRVEKIDSNTVLMVLPPFTIPNAPLYVKEMIGQNDALIRSVKNLIIDLRNNQGGDDNTFDSVFPYLANGPIVRKGSKIRASQENLIMLNHELKSIQDFPQYKETIDPKLREIISLMKANMGKMYQGPSKTFAFDKNTDNPKNVVILVNKNTSSTAESVSLEAKQSSKVTLMGTNTKGSADFTEVRDWGLPCYAWRVAIPLGISHRLPEYPIENIGIKPDVIIPEGIVDWVDFTAKYLNNKK
jgi:hypothetical protein